MFLTLYKKFVPQIFAANLQLSVPRRYLGFAWSKVGESFNHLSISLLIPSSVTFSFPQC